jgi:methylmalonyl-CoA mutase C-terminal domain/subunit
MSGPRQIRVLVAKPGLDGHDRGAGVVARALRDAGMDVIYTGIRQTAAMIAQTAVEEDVDCVGLSIMSGAHLEHAQDVIGALAERGAADIPVVIGGIVPPEDVPRLEAIGVRTVFGPGSPLSEITGTVEALARARWAADAGG